jgi:hypothetical protein
MRDAKIFSKELIKKVKFGWICTVALDGLILLNGVHILVP